MVYLYQALHIAYFHNNTATTTPLIIVLPMLCLLFSERCFEEEEQKF